MQNFFKWNSLSFSDKLQIQPIYDTPTRKEIAILMPANSLMKEHSAPGEIVVQVLSGEISFSYEDKQITMHALDSICLAANVAHSLNAKQNSLIRLSLSKNDSISRVKSVIFK